MAFTRLHQEKLFSKNCLQLKPILLGGLFKLMGQESDPNAKLSPNKLRYLQIDMLRQADLWGVKLVIPKQRRSSLKAMRLIHACEPHRREELSARLYNLYWQEEQNIDDDDLINKLSQEFFCVSLQQAKESLIEATAQAFAARVFGVPTLMLNKRLYFGSDRLELISKELSLASPQLKWTAGQELDFYFDFTSPYSYLAHAEIQKAELLGVNIKYKPVLLGALFKELGQQGVPMFAAHAHKAAYILQDMNDWAQARQVDFVFNNRFPLKAINALRIALIEPKVISILFHAAWAENIDIGQDELLEAVLNKANFDGLALIAKAQEQVIKDRLKANNSEALNKGIFGVPSFIFDNHIVFGQDRFLWLKQQLAAK
jgi:2-hydroxychromene-2-carboxylate isomerase